MGLPVGPWICRKLGLAPVRAALKSSTGMETSDRRSWPFQIGRDAGMAQSLNRDLPSQRCAFHAVPFTFDGVRNAWPGLAILSGDHEAMNATGKDSVGPDAGGRNRPGAQAGLLV